MGWKYYSKATIGICGEHQTNLGALTTNGLIMLVFLIYKFRISHLHPFCKSQDVSEVSEVCQGGVGIENAHFWVPKPATPNLELHLSHLYALSSMR